MSSPGRRRPDARAQGDGGAFVRPWWRAAMIVLVAAVVLLGPRLEARPAQAPPELIVFAASDLTMVLPEIGKAFDRVVPVKLTLVIGSSGLLARQIANGAAADVFLSADQQTVDELARDGHVVEDTKALYARGGLTMVTLAAGDLRLSQLEDLNRGEVRRIAIANPADAPYGRAAEEALRRSGVLTTVRAKLVYADNVRQALQFVETGAAEAGIVSRSIASKADVAATPIDPSLHATIDQAGAVVTRSAHTDLARRFIAFVVGPEGQDLLRAFGFDAPPR